MKHYNNNSGYSIVVSLLMVWFLIIVTSWVFNLVLWELNDNRGRENYLKAFAAAEWAQELALLQIKEKGYGYYWDAARVQKDKDINPSNLLVDSTWYKATRHPLISYDLNSKTNTYSWSLSSLWYAIVPLFVITDPVPPSTTEVIETISDINLSIDSWIATDLAWNILWEQDGISGSWALFPWMSVSWQFSNFPISPPPPAPQIQPTYTFTSRPIEQFLTNPNRQNAPLYLILFNANPDPFSLPVEYTITSWGDFTKPVTKIQSSAQIGKYKQNLETELNNTEFLNILRYSIYSGN